jgi:ATP-dependent exoDNAse (exonuclease V) alpha subunit
MSITTTRNDDVHTINRHLQQYRVDAGDLDPATAIGIADGDVGMVGDVIATRRNDRHLRTSTGEPVRNRQRWTITNTHPDGQITITQHHRHGTITLPAHYVRQHVELAYATTEHGAQGETTDHAITLATTATTGRGLYVAMTRGRHHNTALVLTDTHNPYDAIDLLQTSLHIDRADTPATRQRRDLHTTIPRPTTTPTHPVEHTDPGIDIDF